MQDNGILKSEKKIKDFLEKQGIPYEAGAPSEVLKGKAKARMKRIAEAGVDDDTKRALFKDGLESCLSVVELKSIVENMQNAKQNAEKFYTVTFSIQDLNAINKFSVLKHGLQGACKGTVINGICRECSQATPGIETFSFKAIIADIDDEETQLTVTCANGAGRSMFRMEAMQFDALSTSEKQDKVENVMFVPLKAGVWIKFEAGKGDTALIVIYKVRIAN